MIILITSAGFHDAGRLFVPRFARKGVTQDFFSVKTFIKPGLYRSSAKFWQGKHKGKKASLDYSFSLILSNIFLIKMTEELRQMYRKHDVRFNFHFEHTPHFYSWSFYTQPRSVLKYIPEIERIFFRVGEINWNMCTISRHKDGPQSASFLSRKWGRASFESAVVSFILGGFPRLWPY